MGLKRRAWGVPIFIILSTFCCSGISDEGPERDNKSDENDDAKIETNDSGWSVTYVDEKGTLGDSQGDVGWGTSIALDSDGRVHIAYHGGNDGEDDGLRYASNVSNKWTLETVDSEENTKINSGTGWDPSLGMDSENDAHIAYQNRISGQLKYATNSSGNWHIETLDQQRGESPSLALDSNGSIHLCYEDGSGTLSYLTNASGGWQTETVAYVGYYCSIAVDSDLHIHLSFNDSEDHLSYATNSSGTWSQDVIDDGDEVGQFSKIGVDNNGKIHIAYRDIKNDELKYATNQSGSWRIETIDSDGWYISLVLDKKGSVHISYHDRNNLKYASNVQGDWKVETADSKGFDNGEHSSIVADDQGNVHISYYGDGVLKYATNRSPE